MRKPARRVASYCQLPKRLPFIFGAGWKNCLPRESELWDPGLHSCRPLEAFPFAHGGNELVLWVAEMVLRSWRAQSPFLQFWRCSPMCMEGNFAGGLQRSDLPDQLHSCRILAEFPPCTWRGTEILWQAAVLFCLFNDPGDWISGSFNKQLQPQVLGILLNVHFALQPIFQSQL